jgi:hypothetical protein
MTQERQTELDLKKVETGHLKTFCRYGDAYNEYCPRIFKPFGDKI